MIASNFSLVRAISQKKAGALLQLFELFFVLCQSSDLLSIFAVQIFFRIEFRKKVVESPIKAFFLSLLLQLFAANQQFPYEFPALTVVFVSK